MFFTMIKGTFVHQWKKMLIIALTIALGSSLAFAMLSVVFDVGDKVNQELKTYGANIKVVPKQASLLSALYSVEDEENSGQWERGAHLREDELGKIKTIFWAFNIVDYAPFVKTYAFINGEKVCITGSWFNHHMDLPTGEQLDAGITSMRSWWEIKDGEWLNEQDSSHENSCMLGYEVADKYSLKAGSSLVIEKNGKKMIFKVVGVFESGSDEDSQIYMSLHDAQKIGGLEGLVDSIEVSALTTPDNDLAKKAAKDPQSLTVAQYEIWYCTAYVSSICYQIQEVVSNSVASPVRQVADSEGAILDKTKLLMLLITLLSLAGSALGISNMVIASVMERSREIGLMKAIGACNSSITLLVLTGIMISAIIGGAIGFFAGSGFAQIIGHSIFNSSITIRTIVIPIVTLLIVVVTLCGSIPAVRMLLKLEPAEVLHGGR